MRAAYEERTVLDLGARGCFEGAPFTLVGRTCVRGRRGTLWNEWTLRFDDGTTAFLAESGGGVSLYREGSLVPPIDTMVVGGSLDLGFVIVERGEATRVARWGEVEDAPATYAYAGLSSRSGAEATIDFGSVPPRVFVGRAVTLTELGLAVRSAARTCFVPAPEVSRPRGVETWLDVGDEGDLDGTHFRVVGVISRSIGPDDHASWEEYLLFDPRAGFRWLVVAEGEWSLVEAVAPGRVIEAADGASTATLDGVVYELVSEGTTRLDWATGELPYSVTIGEEAKMRAYLHPPWTLTREWTDDELTWSRAAPVSPDVIAKAFGKRVLPRPPSPSASVT